MSVVEEDKVVVSVEEPKKVSEPQSKAENEKPSICGIKVWVIFAIMASITMGLG